MRHFLEIDDLTPEELRLVLELSTKTTLPAILDGKGVALIFEKPSGRTRNSMEMATVQLGGHPMYIKPEELGICLLYTSPSPRDGLLSRMPSSA